MDRCDRQSLVVPILGLYGELFRAAHEGIKSEGADTVEAFLREIDKHQDEVFPREFEMIRWKNKKRVIEERVLFGDLIDRMKARITTGAHVSMPSVHSVESQSSVEFVRPGSQDFIRHGSQRYVRHGRAGKILPEEETAVPLCSNVARSVVRSISHSSV